MGSKKYTLEPAITSSLHWPERTGPGTKMQTIVIGTRSFNSVFYLNVEDQKKFNEAAIDDSSEESSTWTPEDED